jgi:hypothetical protein
MHDLGGERGDGRAALALRALPWLAFALGIAPLVVGGFPVGHDWLYELVRVGEYRAALEAGQWPPWWSENLYAGYGSPVFLFYAPLFSATATLLGELSGSVARGASAALVLASAASVYTMGRFLSDLLATQGVADRAAARVGTVFFVLHPYLLGDKLVRNADAEFVALCLAPIAFRGAVLATTRPRPAFVLISGGLALVILAHNLTALVGVAAVLGAGLALHGVRDRRAWQVILAGVAAALVLTAFFWLPALAYTGLIRPEELLQGKLDFHGQFPPLQKIFWYVRFFATGLATPLALVAGVWAALRFPDQRRALASLLGAAALLLFLQTRASTEIWESVPMLPFFQFPWRMMGPLAWAASAVVALTFAAALARASTPRRVAAELALFALLILNALPILSQYRAFPEDAERFAPALAHPELIRNGVERVTLGDEYLPRQADPRVWFTQRPLEGPVISSSGLVRWKTLEDRGTRIELETHASSGAARLRLARFAWPGWQLELDGAKHALPASALGVLEVDVPAGDARIRLWLEPPPLRRFALVVSLASLVVWLIVVSMAYVPRR